MTFGCGGGGGGGATPAPVITAPSITAQPTNQTVVVGQQATFAVVASGTAPLIYQWSKNGVAIGGATSASYTTPTTVLGDSGSTFSAAVSNGSGSVTSTSAVLTVNPVLVAPSITAQPINQTVVVGQQATFAVVASGSAPLTYQWSKNGVAISGATSASYTTPTTVIGDSGSTFVSTVGNGSGSVTSTSAVLTVNPVPVAPSITTQPTNQTVVVGQQAIFAVVASGTAPLTYQWSKNGVAINGATSASYTTPTTVLGDSGSTFVATVSNGSGYVTSNAALLIVNPIPVAPSITIQPTNQTIVVGQQATFAVVASGTAPLAYQWSKNGVAINGATSASYTTPTTVLGDSGSTFVSTVGNGSGSVTSTSAVLTVNPVPVAPSITAQPTNQTVNSGASASFTVAAGGYPIPTISWSRSDDGGVTWSSVLGASSATYGFIARSSDNNAFFRATATNSQGETNSNPATLKVSPSIYAGGLTGTSLGSNNSAIWTNGTGGIITNGYSQSVLSIGELNGDIYAVSLYPYGYWKNSTWNMAQLPSGAVNGYVTSLALSGSDVYVGGYIYGNSNQHVPGYWKNGIWTSLTATATGEDVSSMTVVGNNVYAGGYHSGTPGYWINGTWVGLPTSTPGSTQPVVSIFIQNTDVIAVNANGFWKNGTWFGFATPVPAGTAVIAATAVTFDTGHFYKGGYIMSSGVDIPGYWLDGIWNGLSLPGGYTHGQINSICISNSHVYAGGFLSQNATSQQGVPGYWLDGVWTPLPLAAGMATATVGFIVVQ